MPDSKLPEQRSIKTESGNYSERIERNYIHADTVNIYETAASGNDDITSNGKAPVDKKQLAFAIAGSIDEIDQAKLKAILALLQKISGDASIEIIRVEEGSIRLILEGSDEGLAKIRELFESGELTEVLGDAVEYVKFMDSNGLDLNKNTESDENSLLVNKLIEQLPGESLSESVSKAVSYSITRGSSSTVYVENISYNAAKNRLKEIFAEYGKVKRIVLPFNKKTGRMHGFAFVEMETPEQANAAIQALNGTEWMGRSLKVGSTKPQSNLHENHPISSDKHY